MLEKVIDLRCPRISLETGCTIRCVLGLAKFRGVTCLVFFLHTRSVSTFGIFDFRSPSPPIENPWRRPCVGPSKVSSGWPLDAQVLTVGSSEPPI